MIAFLEVANMSREKGRATTGRDILDPLNSKSNIWTLKLHEYGVTIPSKTSIGSVRVEDPGRIYSGIELDSGGLHCFSFYQR